MCVKFGVKRFLRVKLRLGIEYRQNTFQTIFTNGRIAAFHKKHPRLNYQAAIFAVHIKPYYEAAVNFIKWGE